MSWIKYRDKYTIGVTKHPKLVALTAVFWAFLAGSRLDDFYDKTVNPRTYFFHNFCTLLMLALALISVYFLARAIRQLQDGGWRSNA